MVELEASFGDGHLRKIEQVEKVSLFLLTRVNSMGCGKHYETLIKHGSFSKSSCSSPDLFHQFG